MNYGISINPFLGVRLVQSEHTTTGPDSVVFWQEPGKWMLGRCEAWHVAGNAAEAIDHARQTLQRNLQDAEERKANVVKQLTQLEALAEALI